MTILMNDINKINFNDVCNTKLADREPIHVGQYLKTEFLDEMGLTAYALAKAINIPQSRLSNIINGKRSITADTALRLARYFGTSSQFWLNMQANYDLQKATKKIKTELEHIQPRNAFNDNSNLLALA
ncbi:MAG: HigA family addiction module antidote protein [Gammaproteobacteria bacterium]|nr:HigA family addiction module antidote protein [Gammaproteobacteria bacterium]